MLFFPAITALFVSCTAIFALWANPGRAVNRVLSAVCWASSGVLVCQLMARLEGAKFEADGTGDPLFWVRARFSLIALLCPFLVWTSYHVVAGRYKSNRGLFLKTLPWLLVSLALTVVPWTEGFKPHTSLPGSIKNGPLYPIFFLTMLGSQIGVCIASFVTDCKLSGIRKLEFRFITISFGYLSLLAIIAGLVDYILVRSGAVSRFIPAMTFVVFLVFAISSWTVTARRVYDSSEVLLPLLERLALAAVVGSAAILAVSVLPDSEASGWTKGTLLGAFTLLALWLDERLRSLLRMKSGQRILEATSQLHRIASAQVDPENLLRDFEGVLGTLASSRVRLLQLSNQGFTHSELSLSENLAVNLDLENLGWSSAPAQLRSPRTPHTDQAQAWFENSRVNLLIAGGPKGSTPNLVAAFVERENQLPFTYPEVAVLKPLVEIAENLHARSRFSLQARQAEQLAHIGVVGAGVAHELRNPIVAIGTLAQLLPERLDDKEFLKEVAEVLPGEAMRVLSLIDRLADLSRPRNYTFTSVNLVTLVEETLTLLKKPVRDAGVVTSVKADKDSLSPIVADPYALRQVFLNLILNSLHAISTSQKSGAITVRISQTGNRALLEFEDNGPGVPEGLKESIFKPFVSSHPNQGLGLGLSISAEIARAHGGRLTVGESGKSGAVFRLELPIDPTGPRH